jgi:hypothetical protein
MQTEHIRRPLSAFAFCGAPADTLGTKRPRCSQCREIRTREQSRFIDRRFCVTRVGEFLWGHQKGVA